MGSRAKKKATQGATSVHLLVFFVPVFFGFMGFAVDLGRLYLIRGELKTAANAMALAAAQRLIGTENSTGLASASAKLAITPSNGSANKYNFGSVTIGEGSGNLTSAVPEPAYYETAASAIGEGEGAGGSEATGSTAKHVRVTVTADAPLLFWSFLSLGQERKTPVAAQSAAGISAPLCTACGIEPVAIAALDATDTTNFGFAPSSLYTFGYSCTGGPTPSGITGAPQRIPFLLLNRYDDQATLFADESSQLFRIGATGLLPSTSPARSCVGINASEQVWVNAAALACSLQRVPSTVTNFVCGIASRFDTTPQTACAQIPEVDTISSAYVPDSDLSSLTDYTAYIGNLRRVITVPVVESLDPAGMNVLGFRQFLVEPNANDVTINAGDTNARFVVMYIGSVVPLKQGSFSGCSISSGPGKAVLHQ